MVQKSGYYSRAAAPNARDKALIQACAKKAVECALAGIGGVVGEDEDKHNELRACEFPRIKGGKPFNIDEKWFTDLLSAIGQPRGVKVAVKH
jgi:pyrophosphate--fructose-6-phosphate 1-phosphotransferase